MSDNLTPSSISLEPISVHIINHPNALARFCIWQNHKTQDCQGTTLDENNGLENIPVGKSQHRTATGRYHSTTILVFIEACCQPSHLIEVNWRRPPLNTCSIALLIEDTPQAALSEFDTQDWVHFSLDSAETFPGPGAYLFTIDRRAFTTLCLKAEQTTSW